jgi:hypothetical protein
MKTGGFAGGFASENHHGKQANHIVIAFTAGAAIFALAPGLSTTVQRMLGKGRRRRSRP